MSKIRILPEHIVNKIAAGEVVERPASVVKELVENSIDAGASSVEVVVRKGGRELIRVSDDGEGMSREDALLALSRHATSKISSEEDLEAISTLGFRGEALPSIAAVSRLTLSTKREGDLAGTQVVVEGGMLKDVREVGRDLGTTVEVRDIFFNTPARRKFLRSTETELRHITQVVTELALAHPGVAFSLSHGARKLMVLPRRRGLSERMEDIFGKERMTKVLPVSLKERGIEVEGAVGLPELARRSGVPQHILVNGRPISHRNLSHAVYLGYGELLPKEASPFFVLSLRIDPRAVDVNVHPTKREVRFSDERKVFDAVVRAVRAALQTEALAPHLEYPEVHPRAREIKEALEKYISKAQQLPLSLELPRHGEAEEGRPVPLWQAHNKYIFAQVKNGIIIVDQHAAHERVLYEEALRNLSGERPRSQHLLFPAVLTLSPVEMRFLEESAPLLEALGFVIRVLGKDVVAVDAVPAGVGPRWRDGELFSEIVGELAEGGTGAGLKEKLAAVYSCRAAIKAGEPLSPKQMQQLIDQLFATEQPFVCPHGRPTLIRVPLEDLDRQFGRR